MGLICFGMIACLRMIMAVHPAVAAHYPVHKVSAIIGIMVTLVYVLISGGATSAIRAFIMAVLIVAAVLADRAAITIRNVALAAMAILLINPGALLTAGFQLSFAATAILVLWLERRHMQLQRNPSPKYPRFVRYIMGLFVLSALAGMTTAPFAAQHFGSVTPWGVAANIAAIPLTGLWIMPAGLLVMMAHILPDFVAVLPLWMMASGIDVLVQISAWFAQLPGAGFRVSQPGYGFITIGLVGCLAMSLCPGAPIARYGGVVIIMLAIGLWATKRPADIAIMAAGRPPVAVISSNDGPAKIYTEIFWHKKLSAFFTDTTALVLAQDCLLYTSPSPRDYAASRMPSSA